MSKHSLNFVLKEDKFSLRTVIYFFVLIDLCLIPFDVWEALWYLLIYQVTIIVSLMVGLKGQGKYKQAMGELQSIARDKRLTVDEREHMLVQGVHHYCLELGTIYLERNKKQFNKKDPGIQDKKIIKNMEEKTMSKLVLDEIVWKQIGYSLVGIWGLFGLVIAYMLNILDWHWVIVIFLTGTWEIFDGFMLFYIHYVFKLDKDKFTKGQIKDLLK